MCRLVVNLRLQHRPSSRSYNPLTVITLSLLPPSRSVALTALLPTLSHTLSRLCRFRLPCKRTSVFLRLCDANFILPGTACSRFHGRSWYFSFSLLLPSPSFPALPPRSSPNWSYPNIFTATQLKHFDTLFH